MTTTNPTIWQELAAAKKPFFVLAPMDDVTDTVFREIVGRHGAPDIMMTEFASSDGYAHPKGRESVMRRLEVSASERDQNVPLIAQIWGNNPDHYYAMARDLGTNPNFVGIDINMGCPEKGIVKRGCCGGLINEGNWENAAAIIQATKAGAGALPVSVKTRIGLNRIITEEWATHILKQDVAALTIHGRTVREMSKVPARWNEIAKVAPLRDKLAPQTVLIGNGDVLNREQGTKLAAEHGIDGVMIGRGIFHDLFAFSDHRVTPDPTRMLTILREHIDLYDSTWGASRSYDPLKKFCKLYINGFPGAAELRAQLMETHTPDEARVLLDSHLTTVDAI